MEQAIVAQHINTLGAFCGRRDVPELTAEAMQQKYGFAQADVMVLFGGSILCGAQLLAQAMQRKIAKAFVIVGGEGHTTQALREQMHACVPEIDTRSLPEAQVFAAYLHHRYKLVPDFLECQSTNCGNNITNLLRLLVENGVAHRRVILCQDAAMQLRMDAGLRKHFPADTICINYAAYAATVVVEGHALRYEQSIWGMWELEQYVTLLMGEIPRLTDDAQGYGPRGKNFIAHVDVPQTVRTAFAALQAQHGAQVRQANPLYRSEP